MLINISRNEADKFTKINHEGVTYNFNLHWTDYQDTSTILDLILGRPKVAEILEIGTHFGYTTANIAKVFPYNVNIDTVDIVKELCVDHPEFQAHEVLTDSESGKICRYLLNVNLIRSTSDDFFKHNKKKYDVIFIDGSHDKEQVIKDSLNAYDCLSEEGIIIWHDVYNKYTGVTSPKINAEPDNPGVVEALKEIPLTTYKIEDSWIAFSLKSL